MSIATNSVFGQYRRQEAAEADGGNQTPPRTFSQLEGGDFSESDFSFSPVGQTAVADEWSSMPALQPNSNDSPKATDEVGRFERIDYSTALAAMVEAGAWRAQLGDILRENHDGRISLFPCECCTSSIDEGSPEFDDRDRVLALQRVGFAHGDVTSRRVLLSIYRFLIPKGASTQTRGRHWEALGFQGDDPATDLRATGMVGLLHVLYAIQEAPVFVRSMFADSQSATHEFPFVLVCFNMSAVGVECLQRQGLHSLIRSLSKKGSATPASTALAEFVLGCLFHFQSEWGSAPQRSIADFGRMKAAIVKKALTPQGVDLMIDAAAQSRMFVSQVRTRPAQEERPFSSF